MPNFGFGLGSDARAARGPITPSQANPPSATIARTWSVTPARASDSRTQRRALRRRLVAGPRAAHHARDVCARQREPVAAPERCGLVGKPGSMEGAVQPSPERSPVKHAASPVAAVRRRRGPTPSQPARPESPNPAPAGPSSPHRRIAGAVRRPRPRSTGPGGLHRRHAVMSRASEARSAVMGSSVARCVVVPPLARFRSRSPLARMQLYVAGARRRTDGARAARQTRNRTNDDLLYPGSL